MKLAKSIIVGIATVVAMVSVIGGAGDACAKSGYGKQKVVYHINHPGGENGQAYLVSLRTIQEHINAVGAKNLDLRVVINGNGIFLLKSANSEGRLQTAVASLRAQNVHFSVCASTLKGMNISLDQLYGIFEEDVVPSGMAELAHLQSRGYTYIKP